MSRCCGCCTLRCSSLGVAVLNLIVSIAGIAATIFFSTRGEGVQWMRLGIHTVHFLFNCVLIHGIRREKRALVMAWVWVVTILVLGLIILCVVELVKSANPHDYTPHTLLIAAIIDGLLVLIVRSYGLSISDRLATARM